MLRVLDNFIFQLFKPPVKLWCAWIGKSNFALARLLLCVFALLMLTSFIGTLLEGELIGWGLLLPVLGWHLIYKGLKEIAKVEKEFEKSFYSDAISSQLLLYEKRHKTIRLILIFLSLVFLALGTIRGSLINLAILSYAVHFYVLYHFNLGSGGRLRSLTRIIARN